MLVNLVDYAEQVGASDIHLTSNRLATFRIKGALRSLTERGPVTSEHIWEIYRSLGLSEDEFIETNHRDVGATVGDSRLRIHFYNMVEGIAMSIRLIPRNIPDFNGLHLPSIVRDFVEERTGLVIVTGATGSGKSTTLASLVNYMNETQNKKIITVEDPIEYMFEDRNCMIVQREIGQHVNSFDSAIVQAMREDPDVLMVGELRDLDTIQSALRMAETGHLVFGTLHTRGAAESFSRIIDVFPGNQQGQIRSQLANVTKGVISQQLITTKDGKRLPLVEVMKMTSAAKGAVISPTGNMSPIKDAIAQGHSKIGTQTFYQSAGSLIREGLISIDDVRHVFDDDEYSKIQQYLRGR